MLRCKLLKEQKSTFCAEHGRLLVCCLVPDLPWTKFETSDTNMWARMDSWDFGKWNKTSNSDDTKNPWHRLDSTNLGLCLHAFYFWTCPRIECSIHATPSKFRNENTLIIQSNTLNSINLSDNQYGPAVCSHWSIFIYHTDARPHENRHIIYSSSSWSCRRYGVDTMQRHKIISSRLGCVTHNEYLIGDVHDRKSASMHTGTGRICIHYTVYDTMYVRRSDISTS